MSNIVPTQQIVDVIGLPQPRAARELLDPEARETLDEAEGQLKDMIRDLALHIAMCEDPASERYNIMATRMVVLLKEYYRLSGFETAEKDLAKVKDSMIAVRTFVEKKLQEEKLRRRGEKDLREASGNITEDLTEVSDDFDSLIDNL